MPETLSDEAIGMWVFLGDEFSERGQKGKEQNKAEMSEKGRYMERKWMDLMVGKLKPVLHRVEAALQVRTSPEERTRLLKWAVTIQVKLGNLYMGLDKPGKANQVLIKAAEICKREGWHRGGKHAGWNPEEVASTLGLLGAYFAKGNQHLKAFDIYFQAASLAPAVSCERVSLSVSLSSTPQADRN